MLALSRLGTSHMVLLMVTAFPPVAVDAAIR